jgi:hypothetical protein
LSSRRLRGYRERYLRLGIRLGLLCGHAPGVFEGTDSVQEVGIILNEAEQFSV